MSEVAEKRELTFGEKAAGVGFNPSGNPDVDYVKGIYAEIIDKLHQLKEETNVAEAKRYLSKAISYTEDAQMNAVKGITWYHQI